MSESENLITTSYEEAREALKMATQIRRASVVVQEYSGLWKILVINNRYKLANDLNNLDLAENDGYVHINDNHGSVQRNKVQLNSENIYYFAKILGDYIAVENPVTMNFNNPAQKIRSLITVEKSEEKALAEPEDDRSGLYEVQPFEFYCYFKRFNPAALIVEQDVGADCYKSFILHLSLKNSSSLDMVAPAFRKWHKSLTEAHNHLAKNRAVELKLVLKTKILERIKYKMYQIENINTMLQLRNPLFKGILNNVSNYILEEIVYL